MYKVSYEKCVCFIFLVILAILSCSGFRIDNLAMTDVSKRNNFHTSNSFSNSDNFFDRIFNVRSSPSAETVTPVYRHKLRHHRQLRAQAHNSHRRYDTQKPPSGHIDVQVFPPRGPGFPPTTHPSEHFAQIPSTDIHHPLFPTKPIVMTRSQRSSDHKRHQKQEQPRWQPSQEEDFSMKAFKAEIVVLAQVESSSPFQYVFKVNTTYKSKFPVNNRIALRIPSEKEKSQKSKNLVINKIQLGKSYVLFLNASSAHNYWSVSDPKVVGRPIKRARIDKVLKQVCNTKFGSGSLNINITANSSVQ
ncbi:hypothetical protein NQ315_003425 [Exocentrus adspersus]|uniref:DUF4384 domain-containing protein n=1 Tax=Exocentrus adspersus TaxID=1586481 RepID=A0AAV8VPC9_9CUCU|nr:hypothetical protein NQ315_003425 [Exocentrus adspersus]